MPLAKLGGKFGKKRICEKNSKEFLRSADDESVQRDC